MPAASGGRSRPARWAHRLPPQHRRLVSQVVLVLGTADRLDATSRDLGRHRAPDPLARRCLAPGRGLTIVALAVPTSALFASSQPNGLLGGVSGGVSGGREEVIGRSRGELGGDSGGQSLRGRGFGRVARHAPRHRLDERAPFEQETRDGEQTALVEAGGPATHRADTVEIIEALPGALREMIARVALPCRTAVVPMAVASGLRVTNGRP